MSGPAFSRRFLLSFCRGFAFSKMLPKTIPCQTMLGKVGKLMPLVEAVNFTKNPDKILAQPKAIPNQAKPNPKRTQAKPKQGQRESKPKQARAKPSRAKPNQAKPSRAEQSRSKPSRAKPSRAKPSQAKPISGFSGLETGSSKTC